MIKAIELTFLNDFKFEVTFSDGVSKRFDFSDRLETEMGSFLKDLSLFRSGRIDHRGRAIIWEKDGEVVFDSCMDALRYFDADESKEWEGYDDSLGLIERIKIANSRKIAS
jgi:hypothetical protein